MNLAAQLLDSRSFRNKLDAFISIASRKRPQPTDADLAEYLQPVLDAALGMAPVAPSKPVEAPLPVAAPLAAEERAIPQVERSMEDKLMDIVKEVAPRVAAQPMDMKGIRWVNFPLDTPMAELTGFTNDRLDAPFYVDPGEMTMMSKGEAWIVPCRTRAA